MTRRGSLIYYLAAWALGCFFMVWRFGARILILVSSQDLVREATEGFLTLIVYGYLFGAPTALLFGLLLRRIMLALKCKTPMHWAARRRDSCAAGGRSAGIWQPERCARCCRRIMLRYCFRWSVRKMFCAQDGGSQFRQAAATAYYLGRIQRAFALPPNTAPSASV